MILDAQPGVEESAVIGVPHPDLGEMGLALIVPTAGETPDLKQIGVAMWSGLATFKHPRALVVVETLPRNTMGKVQKNLLRADFADYFDGV